MEKLWLTAKNRDLPDGNRVSQDCVNFFFGKGFNVTDIFHKIKCHIPALIFTGGLDIIENNKTAV